MTKILKTLGEVRGQINKDKRDKKKKEVQIGLKEKLSICVDMVKQGFGSTNDGNTARKFFNNADVVSEVTGVDKVLIERFAVILQVQLVFFSLRIFHYII